APDTSRILATFSGLPANWIATCSARILSSEDSTVPVSTTRLVSSLSVTDSTEILDPGITRASASSSALPTWDGSLITRRSSTWMVRPLSSIKKILVSPPPIPWTMARVRVRMIAAATLGWETITSATPAGRSTIMDLLSSMSRSRTPPYEAEDTAICAVWARAGMVCAPRLTRPATRSGRNNAVTVFFISYSALLRDRLRLDRIDLELGFADIVFGIGLIHRHQRRLCRGLRKPARQHILLLAGADNLDGLAGARGPLHICGAPEIDHRAQRQRQLAAHRGIDQGLCLDR